MNPRKIFLESEAVEDMTAMYQILRYARHTYPDNIAYRQLEGKDKESSVTFFELYRNVNALRAALLERGLTGKHIAVYGESSIAWITVYLAITTGIDVCVPIDRELPVETVVTQINFSDAEIVFTSGKSLGKLRKALAECPKVRRIVIMRENGELAPGKITSENPLPESIGGKDVLYMKDLIARGLELERVNGWKDVLPVIDPDTTCLIIFTSGTTGANKGVMLSNRNIMGTLRGCARLLHFPGTSISVLPINHSYELHAHLMSCIYCGTTVVINDDLKHLLKNLELYGPEMSCMVPMMLDLIARKIRNEIVRNGQEKRFDRAVRVSNALRKCRIDLRKKFFKKLREPLGGNLDMIICGGAPLSQDTVDFFDNIGVRVYNGYGITECAPVVAVNPLNRPRKLSVGHVLPTTDVRVADPDENGNGEIQFRGDMVMQGYYKDEESTKAVFTDDGWFRTGDVGYIDTDGYLYLCGRLKNLIILPNGKNVYPEEVEEALHERIPYIKECVVFADKDNTGIYAIFYLDRDFVREHGLDTLDRQKEFMKDDVRRFNSEMPGFKRLTDYEMTDREFEKSTTKKIQRFKITAAQNK